MNKIKQRAEEKFDSKYPRLREVYPQLTADGHDLETVNDIVAAMEEEARDLKIIK